MTTRKEDAIAAPGEAPQRWAGAAVLPVGRRLRLAPSVAIGTLCIVAGGLVAAISAAAPSEKASWTAAYLVLVGGVAQIGLALGQAAFGRRPAAPAGAHAVAGGWSAGNALVVIGTLAGVGALVNVGGLVLWATLILLFPSLRHLDGPRSTTRRWLMVGYRGLVALLLVSIPAGLVLARFRS